MRITPATAIWTGLGTDTNWTTAANWMGNTPPNPGDDLNFPTLTTSTPHVSVNNFTAGTSFDSITIGSQGYALSGSSVVLSSPSADIITTYGSGASSDAMGTTLTGGTISLAAGGTLDLSGELAGTAGLSLFGGGVLDLLGANTFTGTTTVTSSTLLADSTIPGAVQNNGGVIGGNGTVGNVTSVSGTISPGHNPSPGVLTVGSLSLDGSSAFRVVLDGTSPGNGTTGYDQLVAGGAVNLGGAALHASIGTAYTPALGDQLTIIQNNSGSPITGTFAGLAEGATVNISGTQFQITYQGGSNHEDVVLTALTASSSSATTTTVATSNEVAVIGQPVTFTATVSPVSSTATPTGAVVFLADNNPIGVGVLNSSDQATFTTSSLGYGFHTITATYVGDSVFQSSTSSAIGQFITSVGTQPTLTVLPVRNRQGKIVKLDIEAQIGVTAPGTGTPLGNTTFFVNGRASYKTVPTTNGVAVLTLPVARLINRYVFARYLGYFTSFQPSVSTSILISRRTLQSLSATRTVPHPQLVPRVAARTERDPEVESHVSRGHRHHP